MQKNVKRETKPALSEQKVPEVGEDVPEHSVSERSPASSTGNRSTWISAPYENVPESMARVLRLKHWHYYIS